MKPLKLSLRNKKILHYIQNQTAYIKGEDLANFFHVSTKTIRSAIKEINIVLQDYNIHVAAKPSQGYKIEAENIEVLKRVIQTLNTSHTRDDRIRHLAFRLCLSDEPIDLYDLDEEMDISHSTLAEDLKALNKKYFIPENIFINRNKNAISLQADERQLRTVLRRLYTDNWNYDSEGDAYYLYQYIDEKTINYIITPEVNYYMVKNNILLEDVNIVILTLMIAIIYYRIIGGHKLTEAGPYACHDQLTLRAVDEMFDSLEEKLACKFSPIERNEICVYVSCFKLPYREQINSETITDFFDPIVIKTTQLFIRKINEVFGLNFDQNEEFYIIILGYFRYLHLPIHPLNDTHINIDLAHENLLIEFEIAYLIQDLSLYCFDRYLDKTELYYLALCISGMLAHINRTAPKTKTIVMTQYNIPLLYNLKQKLLNVFNDYIDIIATQALYREHDYDYSEVELIVTTANKSIDADMLMESLPKIILVSPFFTSSDCANVQAYISKKQITRLYNSSLPSLQDLLSECFWHEQIDINDSSGLIEMLAMDFVDRKYVSREYLISIEQRESILSFSFGPSLVLVFSLIPSSKTCLSVATLKRSINWNNYKVNIVVMAAICSGNAALIFRLINELYNSGHNLYNVQKIKNKEEMMEFFQYR
jgi:lichenan operon transcriptional antiterminator